MRRYGKRRGGGGKPYHSNRGSRKASPSPTEMLYKHGDQLSEETEEDLFDYMTNGQYRGHVSEIEKLRYINFLILIMFQMAIISISMMIKIDQWHLIFVLKFQA